MSNCKGLLLSLLLLLGGVVQIACGGGGGGGNSNGSTALTALAYSANPAVYTKDVAISANTPTVTGGAATSFVVSPALPAGLRMDATSGVISGTPTTVSAAAEYIVTATITGESKTASVNITVNAATVPTGDCPVATPTEIFTDSDMPVTNKLQTFDLTTPWGYTKSENFERKYPLVVNGRWGEGPKFVEGVRKKYPSFYLSFGNSPSDSEGVLLANLIDEAIKANCRIDTNRIYLTGFSEGGSGSFKLVRGMLTKGKLFAGIIRVAGMSEWVLADEAVEKTSIWYHIGLTDTQLRIDGARTTYTNLKNHASNATAVETMTTDGITGLSRTTKTLTKNGIEIVKMSEYPLMGHVAGPCYNDPAIFDWLFSQSLSCR